jgi:isocitrate/isopropylmalate dehydrogenase
MTLMINVKLVSLPGDGIGIEVRSAALAVLGAAGERWDLRLVPEPVDARRPFCIGVGYTFELYLSASAILLGALGLPDVLHRNGTEAGPDLQFRLHSDLDLCASVRPIRRYAAGPPSPARIRSTSRSLARTRRDITLPAAAVPRSGVGSLSIRGPEAAAPGRYGLAGLPKPS